MHSVHSVFSLFLTLATVRAPAAESLAPSTSPASSAGAGQSLPPSAKRSTDDRQAASSNTPLQTSASPPENPSRPTRCRAHLRNVFAPALRRAPLPPANPPRRSLPHGTAPGSAPAHSSVPAHFPANRNAQSPQWPRA